MHPACLADIKPRTGKSETDTQINKIDEVAPLRTDAQINKNIYNNNIIYI